MHRKAILTNVTKRNPTTGIMPTLMDATSPRLISLLWMYHMPSDPVNDDVGVEALHFFTHTCVYIYIYIHG